MNVSYALACDFDVKKSHAKAYDTFEKQKIYAKFRN